MTRPVHGRRRSTWVAFAGVSVLLLAGYALAEWQDDPDLVQFLKGLTFLEHFAVHYSVGIAFGLAVCLAYFLATRRRANEPLVLLVSVLISHWPDVRFAWRHRPHDAWEVVFLGHTVVDEVRLAAPAFFGIALVLLVAYWRALLPASRPD